MHPFDRMGGAKTARNVPKIFSAIAHLEGKRNA
jgi:hypothetical protein